MQKFCTARGTNLELTIPHTPEQNGIVERKNRTAMESVLAMLDDAKLPRNCGEKL